MFDIPSFLGIGEHLILVIRLIAGLRDSIERIVLDRTPAVTRWAVVINVRPITDHRAHFSTDLDPGRIQEPPSRPRS